MKRDFGLIEDKLLDFYLKTEFQNQSAGFVLILGTLEKSFSI